MQGCLGYHCLFTWPSRRGGSRLAFSLLLHAIDSVLNVSDHLFFFIDHW